MDLASHLMSGEAGGPTTTSIPHNDELQFLMAVHADLSQPPEFTQQAQALQWVIKSAIIEIWLLTIQAWADRNIYLHNGKNAHIVQS